MATTAIATASASSLSFFAPGTRASAGRFPTTHLPAGAGRAVSLGRRALLVRAAQQTEDAAADTPKPAAAASKKTPGLWDALAFSGPAPERINGRLAMVGFVSALAVEATRGDGLLAQAGNGAGLAWFAYTAVVLSAASLAPMLQGESAESRSGGVMTADAELWNGRLAMLGLVALAVTEYLTGAPFVNV
ncbi:low molecular mass early light-inducible protein HV90, chloroplastic-like [Miscanthus floridulus]|uniref:low molecular mass early light-inducible protein HV90, chloroplastic-like n=1 Tax=Miscanthus floridulus TaxID=154761 RepID=UPI00345A677F